MRALSRDDAGAAAGGLDLTNQQPSTNVEDLRYPGDNPTRDAGGPGSPGGPGDVPGTGFAGA